MDVPPAHKVKTLRTERASAENSPVANYKRLQNLLAEVQRNRPYKKPRAIYRLRTWDDVERFVITRAAERR